MGQIYAQGQPMPTRAMQFICRPDQITYLATLDNTVLFLRSTDGVEKSRWQLEQRADRLELELITPHSGEAQVAELLAAIEISFANYPDRARLEIKVPFNHIDELIRSGLLLRDSCEQLTASIELFWQQSRMWLVSPQTYPFPITYVLTQGRRHPLRPPKPVGTVYQRYIPWLDRILSFRTVDLQHDLERFNRWMNDPVVAASWREEGNLAKHHAYLQNIAADPHVIGLIASLDDKAIGYFEVYWAKEDRIAPFFEVNDFDRGWHVLIGEAHFRGRPFVSAWLPSISHYLFLDDCRTQRLVIEPSSNNHKMIRSLAKCGYANLKEFDFPHKRAMLGMLLRERFFAERLWAPRDAVTLSLSASLF